MRHSPRGCTRALTSLGTSHQISLGLDDWDGILLNRSRPGVATQVNVAHNDFSHLDIVELQDRKGTVKDASKDNVLVSYLLSKRQKRFKEPHQAGTHAVNMGRTVVPGSVHGNVVVFLKVDPGVAPREQLTLNQIRSVN